MSLLTNGRKAPRTVSGPRQLLVNVGSLLLSRRRIIRELTTLICLCLSLVGSDC